MSDPARPQDTLDEIAETVEWAIEWIEVAKRRRDQRFEPAE